MKSSLPTPLEWIKVIDFAMTTIEFMLLGIAICLIVIRIKK
jgi:hypothetical protein